MILNDTSTSSTLWQGCPQGSGWGLQGEWGRDRERNLAVLCKTPVYANMRPTGKILTVNNP